MDIATYSLLKRLIDVPYPVPNFPWKPFKIFKVGKRQYATDLNTDRYRNIAAGNVYYVTPTGSAGNDGRTWATATRLSTALALPGEKQIAVLGGLYDKDGGFAGVVPTVNTSIIAVGTVRMSNHYSGLAWTATAGQTNVWQVTRTLVSNICDAATLDANGDFAKLVLQTSIALVAANPGSYYIDGSNVVYVKTADSRQPDTNLRVYAATDSNANAGNTTTYLEGIWFEGGTNPYKCYYNGGRPLVVANRCKFKYGGATGSGCFSNIGARSILIDCEAAAGDQDGFNYHYSSGNIAYFAEIDCIGRDNGLIDDNDNGSTAHEGAVGIRVNGKYYRNKGPNIIDINDGAMTFCVGTEAFDSLAANAVNRANFSTYGESTLRSNMYLLDCYSHGSSTYDVKMDAYGHTFARICEFAIGANFTISTDILDTY